MWQFIVICEIHTFGWEMERRTGRVVLSERVALDVDRGVLERNNEIVALRPKAFAMLCFMVSNSGRVLSKDELIQAVWGNVIVTDDSLTQVVVDVRRAIGDETGSQLRALRKRGYLFSIPASLDCALRPAEQSADEARSSIITAPAKAPRFGVDAVARSERRHLTVMHLEFAGAVESESFADPEIMHEALSAYFLRCAEILRRYGGVISTSSTQALTAIFGYPRSYDDSAERAVRASLAVADAIVDLAADKAELGVRVGVATGVVVVSESADDPPRIDVVGQTPVLAADLVKIADRNAVVVAEGTWSEISRLFIGRALDLNKGRAWRVLKLGKSASRFYGRQSDAPLPMIGRVDELDLLLRRWAQVKGGAGRVILVSGEPGIGKSRLITHFAKLLESEPHEELSFDCSPLYQTSALQPFINELCRASDISIMESMPDILEKLAMTMGLSATTDGSDLDLVIDCIQPGHGGRSAAKSMTPAQRKQRLLEILVNRIERLSTSCPVLLLFEDVHWIDPSSLETLHLLIDRLQNRSILLILTFRPEFSAPWERSSYSTSIALSRVDHHDSLAIAKAALGQRVVPDAVLNGIVEKCDGVPLFIEELTKFVLASEQFEIPIRHAGEPTHVAEASVVPPTLNEPLMARLDGLATAKAIAQIASVIGREFDYPTLAALTDYNEGTLLDALKGLADAELVFCRGIPPDAKYLFKHALVCDAAYASLVKARRQTLHGRLLEILEAQGREVPPEVKAYHAEAAGRLEAALRLWAAAGEQSLSRPAYAEAIANFERAVQLCRTSGNNQQSAAKEQSLQLRLGQALIANQGYQAHATMAVFERALALADAAGDTVAQLPALFGLWAGQHIAGTGSRRMAERYAAASETQTELGPRIVGYRMLGLERFYEGRFEESSVLIDQSLELYSPTAHRDLAERFGHDPRAAAANYKAWNLWHLGYPEQAARTLAANLQWAHEFKHHNTTGLVLCMGTMTNIWLRQPRLVEQAAREVIQLAEDMQLALWHAWGRMHLGWALSQDAPHEGLDEMEGGVQEATEIGAGRYEPFHLGLLAEAYARAGKQAAAKQAIARAFASLEAGHHEAFGSELYRTRARILQISGGGNWQAVATDLEKALRIARAQKSPSLELRAARDLSRVLADRGRRQEAYDTLAPVFDCLPKGFNSQDHVEAAALLASLH